jgi:hypothetical protein
MFIAIQHVPLPFSPVGATGRPYGAEERRRESMFYKHDAPPELRTAVFQEDARA